jgi:acetyl-CoA synthetase
MDVRNGVVHHSWFKGGTTNVCYNAVDRHVEAGHGDRVALFWEGNDVGQEAVMTYAQLQVAVCKMANYLASVGVGKGDTVVIYLPMLLDLPVTMLACARLGAIHSVVFGGFSAEALSQRVGDCKPKVVVTTTAVKRGAKPIGLKSVVDAGLQLAQQQTGVTVPVVLVIDNPAAMPADEAPFTPGRDVWWHDVQGRQAGSAPVTWVDAEDPLFMLYTSGSTGKPKGVVHSTGGYMVYSATTFKYVFDYRPGDVYWCTADCGWITGHSYLAYGPLLCGATQVVFEGVPTWPDAGRCWAIVDKYKVTQFYTAPTAIRSLERLGDAFVTQHSRASLRVLGSVGEPINPGAWEWYFNVVGNGRCPISDTWWQTETGGHMITPLPGAHTLKPGAAGLPFFGVQPVLVDPQTGKPVPAGQPGEGVLCIAGSWPGAARTLYGDHERFATVYYAPYPGLYFTSDGARRDEDGYYWITGRVDDVINVSGHRIGTAEVESALVGHPACAEAAVVGYDHPVKGQGIWAYVSLMDDLQPSEALRKELIGAVRATIGAFAAPDVIHWAPVLPKTRSGKIMRRILRKIAANELDQLGDTSTLADPSAVETLLEFRGK